MARPAKPRRTYAYKTHFHDGAPDGAPSSWSSESEKYNYLWNLLMVDEPQSFDEPVHPLDVPSYTLHVAHAEIEEPGWRSLQIGRSNLGEYVDVYDPTTNKITSAQRQTASEIRWSHVTVEPDGRYIAFEQRNPGATINNLTKLLEHLLHAAGMRHAQVWFVPVVGPGFAEAVSDLSRIQKAAIEYTEPNYDWQDSDTVLARMAEDSEARTMRAEATSRRGKTLRKDQGIVAAGLRMTVGSAVNVMRFEVRGKVQGEDTLRTLSSDNYRSSFEWRPDATGSVAYRDRAARFLTSIKDYFATGNEPGSDGVQA